MFVLVMPHCQVIGQASIMCVITYSVNLAVQLTCRILQCVYFHFNDTAVS